MIATGGFSPLEGFMNQADYESVLSQMRLKNGLPWSIPITLSVTEDRLSVVAKGTDVALRDPAGRLFAILHLSDRFEPDKDYEAQAVYGTGFFNIPASAGCSKKAAPILGVP